VTGIKFQGVFGVIGPNSGVLLASLPESSMMSAKPNNDAACADFCAAAALD
jgi:hypothetical protein